MHAPFTYPVTLPFIDPGRTVRQLERGIDGLKFKGACIGTNISDMGLDNQSLYLFYERISEYEKLYCPRLENSHRSSPCL